LACWSDKSLLDYPAHWPWCESWCSIRLFCTRWLGHIPSFLRSGRVLVDAHNRLVDHGREIGVKFLWRSLKLVLFTALTMASVVNLHVLYSGQFCSKLKSFRGFATRYEKLKACFLCADTAIRFVHPFPPVEGIPRLRGEVKKNISTCLQIILLQQRTIKKGGCAPASLPRQASPLPPLHPRGVYRFRNAHRPFKSAGGKTTDQQML